MTDLVVLVPSRGRPGNIARLVEACNKTCRAQTLIAFGFDDDDPAYADNLKAADGCFTSVRPRMGLGPWTNTLAKLHLDAPYLASLGDDMVPATDGWDERLIGACEQMGGGMAYPNDLRRDDIPEAVVMDRQIVSALNWMCLPSLGHWFVDNVWSDLGRAAGCIRYLPDVVVEHRNPLVPGGDKADQTNDDAARGYGADMAAYQRWRLYQMRKDVEVVRSCTR